MCLQFMFFLTTRVASWLRLSRREELSDVLGVDLEAAPTTKMIKNARKYPVEAARGNSRKYTDLA